MLVSRWTSTQPPSEEQVRMMMISEGLNPIEEKLSVNQEILEHRHPFDEIRIVVNGTLLMNISGNKLLLRPGDRIDIPANTKHAKKPDSGECFCLYALKSL